MLWNVPFIPPPGPTRITMRSFLRRQASLAILATSVATFGASGEPCFAGGHQHGPVYRTLDTLAGGIETAISTARSVTKRFRGGADTQCDDAVCDDGCDTMTLQELEMMPPAGDHHHLSTPMPPSTSGILPTPIESMPEYQTPLPPSIPSGPRTVEPRAVEPLRPQQTRPGIPQPMPNTKPVTPQPKMNGQPKSQPQLNGDEDWMEGFSPEPPKTQPNSRPLRNPAETIDSLRNPFQDDPQSKNQQAPRSLNSPASYWETW